ITSPTLLDAGVLRVPMVPIFVEAVNIANNVPKDAGEKLLIHTDTRLQGKRTFKADIVARPNNASRSEPTAIEIRGLVCKAIPGVGDVRSTNIGNCHKLGLEFRELEGARNSLAVEVTLIQPRCPSPATQVTVSSLSSLLGKRLVRISSNFLDVADTGLHDKVYICLAEMDEPILKDLTVS
ncbi:MAG: hypothetical protein Q9204_009325, partial [Flavoplaca sp. TL-2023a]